MLDSSNIEIDGEMLPHQYSLTNPLVHPSDWVRIATEIELNYAFDAFLVLHGTDTMAYTASALSFMLEDLGKTVVSRLFSHSVIKCQVDHFPRS